MADITTLERDEIARRWRRDYQFRIPGADVGEGTEQHVLSLVVADQLSILMSNSEIAGRGPLVRGMTGQKLIDYAKEKGPDPVPLPATGSSGYVAITTATGGATIYEGDEATDDAGLRFQCLQTDTYTTSTPVPLRAIDTGVDTNLPVGTKLTWSNPRPGCAAACVVADDGEGEGLTGGHPEETEVEIQDRILEREANPPAAGNVAAYIAAAQKTPGVPVEKAFCYPAILGPGTMGIAFTVRSETDESRIATSIQEGLVEANLKGQFPEDDGIFACALVGSTVDVAIELEWRSGVEGFVDASPWPPAIAGDFVVVSGTPTATAFRATTATSTTTPQVGQTVGLYDASSRKFRAKRIASVSVVLANKTWDLTVDTTAGASDTSFVPAVGAMLSPWAGALDSIVEPVRDYFRSLGPGEQVATFYDAGDRQRRIPRSPEAWPSTLTNIDTLGAIRTLVRDAEVLAPTIPYATPTGTAGVLSYLLELGDLAIFAQ
jgi:hypothetical protein